MGNRALIHTIVQTIELKKQVDELEKFKTTTEEGKEGIKEQIKKLEDDQTTAKEEEDKLKKQIKGLETFKTEAEKEKGALKQQITNLETFKTDTIAQQIRLEKDLNSEKQQREKIQTKQEMFEGQLSEEKEYREKFQEGQQKLNTEHTVKLAEEKVHREHHRDKLDKADEKIEAMQASQNQMFNRMIESQAAMMQAQSSIIGALTGIAIGATGGQEQLPIGKTLSLLGLPAALGASAQVEDIEEEVEDGAVIYISESDWTAVTKLGDGFFGEVILCKNEKTEINAAVKFIPCEFKPDEEWNNEVNKLKSIEHERVAEILEMFKLPNKLLMCTEYLSAGSVKDELRGGPLLESVIRLYTRQVLEGLAYIHGLGIVHGDIKCSNFLKVADSNQIKITDTGLSKVLSAFCSEGMQQRGEHGVYWMAPEVVGNQPKSYETSADIWSLGAAVVEMITTKPPMASYSPKKAALKLELAAEDGINVKKFIKGIEGGKVQCFLEKLFVEEDKRPTAESMIQDSWIQEENE